MKKTVYTFIIFFLCAITVNAQISSKLPTPPPSVSQHNSFTQFESIDYHNVPGEPNLPVTWIVFLLPPDADLANVTVTLQSSKEEFRHGEYDVKPAPLQMTQDGIIPVRNRTIVNRKDVAIYSENNFFPGSYLGNTNTGQLRDYKLIKVAFYPYQYNPVSKKLKFLSKGQLLINYKSIPGYTTNSAYKIPFRTHALLIQMVVNYSEMSDEYRNYPVSERGKSKYVIITTTSIKSNSNKLGDFISSKRNRGFDVELVTDWGGGTGNVGAENIRKWLLDNYQSKNIEYVLLIGNPDPSSGDVPMKMTYPYRDVPTDFYYCDLSSNWDKSGNGQCGEQSDLGSGGIDHIAEVSAGRIPVYNNDYQTLDHILEKTITYENTPSSEIGWRKKMLLAMKGYNAPAEGSRVGEAIKNKVSSQNSEWTYYRIYDDGVGNPELNGVSENYVLYAMSLVKTGLVEWMTHGSSTNAHSVMSVSGTSQWDDEHPSIVFCGSCLNATPSVPNNLTYSLLKNGAIGAVGGTQTTIFSTGSSMETSAYNSGCIYQFGVNIAAGKMYASDALNEIRATCEPSGNDWQNYLAYNLYGCPAIGIETNGDNTNIKQLNNNVASNLANGVKVSYNHNNAAITVHYNLINSGIVNVSLYSTRGQLIKTLINGTKLAGSHSSVYYLNNMSLSNSMYICRITSKNSNYHHSFIVLK